MKASNERSGSTGRRGWANLVLAGCAAVRAGAAGAFRTALAVAAVAAVGLWGASGFVGGILH